MSSSSYNGRGGRGSQDDRNGNWRRYGQGGGSYGGSRNDAGWNRNQDTNRGRGQQERRGNYGHSQSNSSYNRYGSSNRSNYGRDRTPFHQENHNDRLKREFNAIRDERAGQKMEVDAVKKEELDTDYLRPKPEPKKEEPSYKRVKNENFPSKLVINKENWDQATLLEKQDSQYHFDIENFTVKDQLKEDSEAYMAQKIDAAAEALRKVEEELDKRRDDRKAAATKYDSDDSERSEEDNYMRDILVQDELLDLKEAYTRLEVKQFIEALPYNIIFDAGFRVVGIQHSDLENCYCPCSRLMANWRNNFNLCVPADNTCSKFKKGDPNALMGHLRTLSESDTLHKAVVVYLEALYANKWGEGIGHKGLYIKNDTDYNRAESAEKKVLNRALEDYRKQLEEMTLENKKLLELQAINKDMADNRKQFDKILKDLGIKEEKKNTGDIPREDMDAYRDSIITLFDCEKKRVSEINKKKSRRKKKLTPDEQRRLNKEVEIEVPADINLQKLFNEWHDKEFGDDKIEGDGDPTDLFRDIDSYDFFLKPWNVMIQAPPLSSNKKRKKSELEAEDEGGLTRTFINAFCEQMGDLSIYVPIRNEHRSEGNGIIEAEVGGRVFIPNPEGMIDDDSYGCNGIITKSEKLEDGNNSKKYAVRMDNGEELFNMRRGQFVCRTVKIPLFGLGGEGTEKNPSFGLGGEDSFMPCMDFSFESHYDRSVKPFGSDTTLEDIMTKARRFYRAIGRFMLHVLSENLTFDNLHMEKGKVNTFTLSTTVLPELLRNVLLRNVYPGSSKYPLHDLVTDLKHIGEANNVIGTTFKDNMMDNDFLEKFDSSLKEEDTISQDNYEKYVFLRVVKMRDIAISSLEEGFTLGGVLKIQKPFWLIPPIVLNKLLFNNPSYTPDDIIKAFKIHHSEEDRFLERVEMQEFFFENTLPETLRILSEKDDSFLRNFLFYVTGASFLPHLDANPQFKITIAFSTYSDIDSLPTASTCVNELQIPAEVYDNDAEVFAERLETAVNLGKVAGFGFA